MERETAGRVSTASAVHQFPTAPATHPAEVAVATLKRPAPPTGRTITVAPFRQVSPFLAHACE